MVNPAHTYTLAASCCCLAHMPMSGLDGSLWVETGWDLKAISAVECDQGNRCDGCVVMATRH